MLSAYAISILSAQGAWREGWSEDALRARLTELGAPMAHAEVEAALFADRGRARKGDGLLVVDGLELGTVKRLAAGDEPWVDGRLVVGRHDEQRVDVDAQGRVFVAGVHTADSLAHWIEALLRERELLRNHHLLHTPAEHAASFAEALALSPVDEACDTCVRYLSGGVVRARVRDDVLTLGVRRAAETKAIVEYAATHELRLRYEAPEAVLMV